MHKTVGGIIKNKEGKILMIDRVKYPLGWACPAGHIEEDEAPDQALRREIKEEVNLDIKKYKLLKHEFLEWNKCSRGVNGHDWYLYEILEWEGDLKIEEKEAKNYDWFSLEEIKKLKLEKAWKYWFEKIFNI